MAEYRIRLLAFNSVAVVTLGIVASIVTSTIVASSAYRSKYADAQEVQQSIVVKGKATQRVHSDRGMWWITVIGTGESIQSAHTTLADGIKRVDAFLDERNFMIDEIRHGAITTKVHYNRDEEGNKTRKLLNMNSRNTSGSRHRT